MKYKSVANAVIVFILLITIIIAFFCFVAFSGAFKYRKSFISNEAFATYSAFTNTTVIIDPGHGGQDPGAVSMGLREKDINLSLSLYLKDFLCLSGYNVVMTRTDDTLLGAKNGISSIKTTDLKARLEYINAYENSVFISIHMNKFESINASGLQTFYSDNCAESATLARYIQKASLSVDPDNKRTIKPDGDNIYILEHANKPAVLVECGFLSNPKDAANLSSAEYQQALAFCIYEGITEFLGENQK